MLVICWGRVGSMCAGPGYWLTAPPTCPLSRGAGWWPRSPTVPVISPPVSYGRCCASCAWSPTPRAPRPASNTPSRTAGSCWRPPRRVRRTCCCWTSPRMWRRRPGNASTTSPGSCPAMTAPWISVAPTSPSTCSVGHSKPLGRGMVDLTMDLQTLLGLAGNPGESGGWGPVVADITRQVTDRQTDGRWQATVIDDNGDPHAVAVRRRPHNLPGPPSQGAAPHLRVPRMPATRPGLPTRSRHQVCRRRPDSPTQPDPTVHLPSQGEGRRRLEVPAPTQRRPHLDQPGRAHLHHRRPISVAAEDG